MDKKLQQILEDFSMKLHGYEEEGNDLPEEVEELWSDVTDVLMME